MPDITELQSGLWVVQAHLTDFQVRGVLVAGSDRAVIFDSLSHPDDMEGVAEVTPDLPLSLVYSHGDWDHVWGTSGISRPVDEIIAHERCGPRFSSDIPETLATMRLQEPGRYDSVELIPPTRGFPGKQALALGGITLELHALPGHTPDTIVGFIPEWGILLAGDAVETPLPFLNPGSPLEEWASSLDQWAERLDGCDPAATVIPSHGKIGGPALLKENANYLRAIGSGRDPEVPSEMDSFYRETHENNVVLAGKR